VNRSSLALWVADRSTVEQMNGGPYSPMIKSCANQSADIATGMESECELGDDDLARDPLRS
jgi:hypothetical protein